MTGVYRVIDIQEREVVNYLNIINKKRYPEGRYLYLPVEDNRWLDLVDFLYI